MQVSQSFHNSHVLYRNVTDHKKMKEISLSETAEVLIRKKNNIQKPVCLLKCGKKPFQGNICSN